MKKWLGIVLLGLISLMLCGCMRESTPPQLGLSDPNEKILEKNIIFEDIIVEDLHVKAVKVVTWDSDNVTGWD